MKKLFVLTILVAALQAQSQLIVNIPLPPDGILQKSQLWNMSVTNTGTATVSLHIELTFSDVANSMQLMSAATQVISIPRGTTHLSNVLLQPIQYNVMNPGYAIDVSPNGLLPVGSFEVCYSFMAHSVEDMEKIAEDCRQLIIEPLSPPLLVYPFDQDTIETKNPALSWLPPMPVHLFTNLRYDLDLVEVYPSQSPSDAVQQNLPVFRQQGIPENTIRYPVSAQLLKINKQYAWRITATSNHLPVAQSEAWVFLINESEKVEHNKNPDLPFAKLKKNETGYAIYINEIRFDYLNENADSTWNLKMYDLTTPEKKEISLLMDSIPLKPGQNMVKYDVSDNRNFVHKHLYLLEIINSRNESWSLKFEYRNTEE